MGREIRLAMAAGVVLLACGFFGARHAVASRARSEAIARSPVRGTELHVPHVKGSIVLDGDTDDPGWAGNVARTGAFVGADGADARPYSDTRITWGDGHLYVMLYAADEEIRATQAPESAVWLDDSFHLSFTTSFGERVFDVSARGAVTDGARRGLEPVDWSWQSGAHVSFEMDGTLNDPRDDDEEWVIEMAIPFEALGLTGERGERIGFAAHRCDTPKRSPRVCGSFGETGEGVVLVLE